MKNRRYLWVLVLPVLLLTVTACNKDSHTRFTSATITADSARPAGRAAPFIGTSADVTSMTVDVINGSAVLVSGATMTNSSGSWGVTIDNLPVGPQLTFVGHAFNGAAVEIFNGSTTQVMTGTDDQVAIFLAPVSSGAALQFPRITQIMIPSQITVSTGYSLRFTMEGSVGDTLSYELKMAQADGSFTVYTGTQTLIIATTGMVYSFTAPSVAGTYTNYLLATNGQGNSVQVSFDTVVVDQQAAAALSVQFNPVITSIAGQRSGSEVTFTAGVNDDGPAGELGYLWSFDSGLSFSDASVNPAVLQGYDGSASGTLTLTVTDRNGSGGSTTVSYPLPAGLFPDSLVVSPAPVNIATEIGGLTSIAGDSQSLYWTDAIGGTVKKISMAGGTVTTLASGLDTPKGIIVYQGNVFWTEATATGTIKKIPTGGGAIATLASNLNNPSLGMVIVYDQNGTMLYWTEAGSGLLRKINIDGGAVTDLALGLNLTDGNLAYSGNMYLVWAESGGTIKKINIGSGTPTVSTVITGQNATRFLAADSSYVYWTEQASGKVKKVPMGGGTVTTLATGLDNPTYITKGNLYLYVTESAAIKRVWSSGGSVTPLASGLTNPSNFVFSSSLYGFWGDDSSGGSFTRLPL